MNTITVDRHKIKEELRLCMRLYQEAGPPNVLSGDNNIRQAAQVDRFWLIVRLFDLERPYAFPCALDPDKEPERFDVYCVDILRL